MSTFVYIGIDPGKSGGIAFIGGDGGLLQTAKFEGKTEADIASLLVFPGDLTATVEAVHAWPAVDRKRPACPLCKQHPTSRGASSLATFMQSYGFLRGLLTALKIPAEYIAPVTWQRHMRCLTEGNKNVSKAKAEQIYPHARIIHATADAILLARFGYLKNTGKLPPPIKVVRPADPRQQRIAAFMHEEDF